MSTLADEASAILRVKVFPGKWRKTIERIDILGSFTRKNQMELLIMLCEHIEKLEDKGNLEITVPIYGTGTTKSGAKTTIQSAT